MPEKREVMRPSYRRRYKKDNRSLKTHLKKKLKIINDMEKLKVSNLLQFIDSLAITFKDTLAISFKTIASKSSIFPASE